MSQKITITIDTGNAAFDDGNREGEVARILRTIVDDLEGGGTGTLQTGSTPLYDINGNRVGAITMKGGR